MNRFAWNPHGMAMNNERGEWVRIVEVEKRIAEIERQLAALQRQPAFVNHIASIVYERGEFKGGVGGSYDATGSLFSVGAAGNALAGCWCERCDTTLNNGMRTRMSVCPRCGDKRCTRATDHRSQCSAERLARSTNP